MLHVNSNQHVNTGREGEREYIYYRLTLYITLQRRIKQMPADGSSVIHFLRYEMRSRARFVRVMQPSFPKRSINSSEECSILEQLLVLVSRTGEL